jgi:deoxyribodipyrimidine photolyase-related protein
MSTLWLFEDQLSPELVRRASADRVMLVESRRHFGSLPFHKHRIAFQCSAMRHFAEELRQSGVEVWYFGLSRMPYLDALGAVRELVRATSDRCFRVFAPSEHHCDRWVRSLGEVLKIDLEVLPQTLFLTDRQEFAAWARPLKSPVMEHFYRRMRTRLEILMNEDGTPVGGEWNLDHENRKAPKKGLRFPPPPVFPADKITEDVLADVGRCFESHPGSIEGFSLPVTRIDAERAFEDFVQSRLVGFGEYEDAMLTAEPVLNHSQLSMLLNVGLLEPLAMARRAEAEYRGGRVPLNSAEGFIRQIIGWREYVYGIYWTFMPEYRDRNGRRSSQPLPAWFWTCQTPMNCLHQSIRGVVERAYSHHIQRLMVICNFATLAAISPQEVNDWFYAMYVDSHDWVVTPNVIGMGMNADQKPGTQTTTMATKPYISSAAYINRMSDYCGSCRFDPKQRTGDDACPFNFLYWTFLSHFRETLGRNPRMTMMLKNVDRIGPDEMRQMMDQRKRFISLHVAGKVSR